MLTGVVLVSAFRDRLANGAALDEAIASYRRRERRFGLTSAQVAGGATEDSPA